MKFRHALIVIISFMLALLATCSVQAKELTLINYANNYAEFSVGLPEAPSVRTLWADGEEKIPYLKNIPESGSIGEIAFYQETDYSTDDKFTVEVTFLKVSDDFISKTNKATIFSMIKKDLAYLPKLENVNTKYDDTLNKPAKHAIVSGIITKKDKTTEFNSEHFLVGTESILVIRVRFNNKNPKHYNLYKEITDTIKYLPL